MAKEHNNTVIFTQKIVIIIINAIVNNPNIFYV